MKSALKFLAGTVLLVMAWSYVVGSQPVGKTLQTAFKNPNPLVAGARSVQEELLMITDSRHQAVYYQTLQQGLQTIRRWLP